VNKMTAGAWVGAVRALVSGGARVVVVGGDDAAELADALQVLEAPPIAAEGDDLVVLFADPEPPPSPEWDALPHRWADLIVLRHAWRNRAGAVAMLDRTRRVLRPGGRLIAGEPDVNRLLEGSSVRSPARLLYTARPELAEAAAAATAGRAVLGVEAVRAGYGDVELFLMEERRGVFADAASYWEWVRGGGWPALASLSAEDAEEVLEAAAGALESVAPIGPIVDVMPWVAVTGTRR
jgi:hypothetical protein